MIELLATPDAEPEPEKFDFNSPEDVLFEVVAKTDPPSTVLSWDNYTIDTVTVISGKDGVTGAASYEKSYGGFLDYTIAGIVDCPGEGWFVAVGVTATYHRGDGWSTDDSMDFECESVRPATPEEIAQA